MIQAGVCIERAPLDLRTIDHDSWGHTSFWIINTRTTPVTALFYHLQGVLATAIAPYSIAHVIKSIALGEPWQQ
jgi:hypothetical protein